MGEFRKNLSEKRWFRLAAEGVFGRKWLALFLGLASLLFLLPLAAPETKVPEALQALGGASYLLLLLAEIIKANYSVICLILSPKYEIEPKLVKFRVDLKSDTLRAVLADSITLTPGTITVTLEGDEYLVHCLDKDLAEGMSDSEFVRKLKEFERGGKGEEDGTIL